MDRIKPIILTGGSGTRLWPVSRKAYPKQFVPLIGQRSLFQDTLTRFSGTAYDAPLIMTGEDFRFIATDQAHDIGLADARVIVEPVARDTAPAILAAALLLEGTPDQVILVAPSDHVIGDPEAFHTAVALGLGAADGALVTFGITPDRPETGYGYLELAEAPAGVTDVVSFREKPDLAAAKAMLAAGNYLWNAGLFLGRVRDFIAAFEVHAPELMAPVREAVAKASRDLGFERLDKEAFEQARAVSVDYAIMEKFEAVKGVPMSCKWSDLGAWDALWAISEKDGDNNALHGSATAIDCSGSLLRSEKDGPHLVGLGLKDTVAVAMGDAVLVAPKDRVQDVKRAVETLREAKVTSADEYPRYYRPWGWYESLCVGDRFQVKRIMVEPGGVLSVQSHMHRSEHWIVVAGTAEVTVGSEVKLVTENQSVYIPLGEVHRMANRGQVPMFLIEVQTGTYLGEDDIVRYEDIYNRS